MWMHGTWVQKLYGGCFLAFFDLHREMSDRSVCNFAGFVQTSENVCIPDVSAKSVLVLLYVAITHLERRNMT